MRNRLFFVGLFCLFLGWNLPNHYPPWPAYHLELVSACGVVLLFAAVCSSPGPLAPVALQTERTNVALMLPPVALFVLLVAALPWLQLLAGTLVFRGDAVLGSLYGIGLAMSIYVGHLWAAQEGRQRVLTLLFLTIVWGSIAANGLALTQWLRIDAPGWWALPLIDTRPFGNLSQPNHFGLLMIFGLVSAVALYEAGALPGRIAFYGLIAFLGWGVLISQSRAAALAMLAVALCWVLTRRRLATRLSFVEVGGAVVLWLLLYHGLDAIQTGMLLQQEGFKQPLDAGVRPLMWRQFVTAIAEQPWQGYGFNQGVQALAAGVGLSASTGVTIATTYAHDFVLDLMVWAGIPCALVLVLALVAWLALWLRREEDLGLWTQRHWVFAVWLALLVQSLFEYPYAYAYFLLPAGLMAGAVTQSTQQHALATIPRWTVNRVALGLGVTAILMLSVTAADYWHIEDDFRTTRFVRANYVNQPEHAYLEGAWVLDQMALLNTTARYHLQRDMTQEQLDNLEAVARRFQDSVGQLDYAKALALNGRTREAERELLLLGGLYERTAYQGLERQWRQWLESNGISVSAPR